MDEKSNMQDQSDLEKHLPLNEGELDLLALILDEERPLHSGL